MTTIEEEQLDKTPPPTMSRAGPMPPPFAVSPSVDVIMQRVSNSFKEDSSASFERPAPNSRHVFELDVGSPCATLKKQAMPVPKLSLHKQASVMEDGDQPETCNTPPTPNSGGLPTTPTLRGEPTTPTFRGMPAPPTSRGMPALPTSRGMPASPTSRGMPAPPSSRDLSTLPTPAGPQMSQDHTAGMHGRFQASRPPRSPLTGPLPGPMKSREHTVQHVAPPSTTTSELREPLSKNIQSILQHRSLPGQERNVVPRADLSYMAAFNQFVKKEKQPSLAAVGDQELQRTSSVDRRKKAFRMRKRESVDLPGRCIVTQCSWTGLTCYCNGVLLYSPVCLFTQHQYQMLFGSSTSTSTWNSWRRMM